MIKSEIEWINQKQAIHIDKINQAIGLIKEIKENIAINGRAYPQCHSILIELNILKNMNLL